MTQKQRQEKKQEGQSHFTEGLQAQLLVVQLQAV
jgi:hypothetical protein